MEAKIHELSDYFNPIFRITGKFAYNDEKRELVEKIPMDLGWFQDGKIVPVREMLLNNATDSSLLQTAVYDTIVKGASPAACMREAVPVWPTTSPAITVNIGATKGYASKVAAGAEIPINTEHPTSVTITPDKYADRAEITNEMLDDAMVPVIQYELGALGLRLENAMNRMVLDNMIAETVVIHHDCAGTNLGMGGLAGAIGQMMGANLKGTDLVMCPEYAAILLKEYMPTSSYFELGDTARTGALGSLLGVKLHLCNAVPSAGAASTFDYDADGDIGAYLVDRNAVGAIVMRQDITTEDYNNPIRDLKGLKAKMRMAYDHFNHSALCGIEY